ncbi:hypothetical protein C7121_23100 [Paenibacillus glucanolyticus]|jgi:hypothetical protein|uniref:hypothetical protein n=1 Tax=Paenibacillus TaxID=44249 RepID=UPI0003E231F0|nr:MULTISPECIES: hypothetical protein [Paenibacillus]ANA82461.1 hypothetical protein A3958_21895 [Paenibacillus glucanolyticus]AVV58801.1 hypothetical protein C7121_23100 [Paenibacillus glucanolyticus]ETT33834.1 hypothetical protein C169_21458 [Paenibacillus sp. FSL R5-808]
MYKPRKTYVAILFSAAVLIPFTANGVYGASMSASSVSKSITAASLFTLDELAPVSLKRNVTVKLMDMDIFAQPSGNILIYTLRYSNSSGSNVDLIDYFSEVTTTGGSTMQGKPVSSDSTPKIVPAKRSISITYYVNIGKSTKTSGVEVSLFGWDFSSSNYQKRLGSFTIPNQYSSIVPIGQSKKISMNNLPVLIRAESLQKMEYNGKVYMKVGVSLTNGGTKVLEDLGYKAYLKSAGGSIFELLPDETSSRYQIKPREKRMMYYWTEIPSYVKTDRMILQFAQEEAVLNINLPVGSFKLPAAAPDNPVAKGQGIKIMMDQLPVMTRAESLQRLKLNGKVYMKVGVNLSNRGTKVLGDPGHKVYLRTAGGSVFELLPEDEVDTQGLYKIQPQQTKTIYYVAEVPSNLRTDNMMLQYTRQDEVLKMNLPVKTFKLPAAASYVPVNEYGVKKITINHHSIETQLKNASVYTENDSAKWSLQFRMKNIGEKSITIPAYELSINASEGYSIPVNSKALANLTLKPLEEKIVELSADVPLHLKQNALQLQLSEPAVTDKIIFPTAYYKIPYAQEGKNHLGLESIVENQYGTFGVKLSSYHRLPWTDEDQIAAKIRIRNTTSSSVQLPVLKAQVNAGMRDLSGTTQIVAPNDITVLAPNETVELYVLTKVPYSYHFNQLRIVLQENTGEDAVKFLTLNASALDYEMAHVAAGESYQIDTIGRKAEVRERLTTVYRDGSSNLIYTELAMTSAETRQSKPSQLVAYYKTTENQYYEAEVTQSSNSVSPGGKNLVTVWSEIPLDVNTSQLVLHIGEGVADGKLTEPGKESTGSINTIGLALSPGMIQPATNLRNVELFPYNLSITRAEGTLSESKVALDFIYDLTLNREYNVGSYDHKLILEMIDPLGKAMDTSLTLGTDLTIGNHKSYSITFNNNFHKVLSGGTIRMNLYDEFQGRRVLLGSQSYPLITEANQADNDGGEGRF